MFSNNYKSFLLKTPVLTAFLFLAFSFAPVHRYYFSLSEIRIDTKKRSLNVSCKLFTDDLESALSKLNNKKVILANTSQNKENKELITRYLSDHFKISIGGKPLKLVFAGYENEEDATWCYLEVPQFSQKGKVIISNTLLFDFLPEQTNIIQFYWDEQKKSQKLSNPDKEMVVEF